MSDLTRAQWSEAAHFVQDPVINGVWQILDQIMCRICDLPVSRNKELPDHYKWKLSPPTPNTSEATIRLGPLEADYRQNLIEFFEQNHIGIEPISEGEDLFLFLQGSAITWNTYAHIPDQSALIQGRGINQGAADHMLARASSDYKCVISSRPEVKAALRNFNDAAALDLPNDPSRRWELRLPSPYGVNEIGAPNFYIGGLSPTESVAVQGRLAKAGFTLAAHSDANAANITIIGFRDMLNPAALAALRVDIDATRREGAKKPSLFGRVAQAFNVKPSGSGS